MSLVTQVVCAVIRNERGEYLATQRSSGSFECLLEFPGGKVEPCESIEEATSRELSEELSITTTTSGVMLTNRLNSKRKLELVFVATQIIEGDIQLNEHRACGFTIEISDLEWLPGDLPMVEFLSKS